MNPRAALNYTLAEMAESWPAWMTQADIARLAFGWQPPTLCRAIREGRVILPPGVPCGRRIKWPRGVVLAWRQAQEGGES